MIEPALRDRFIEAAIWHGELAEADALLGEQPALKSGDLTLAAIQGDDHAVRAFIAADPGVVNARSGPRQADALNYLCLSKYLRLDPALSDGFTRAAEALLAAGADANTGFWTTGKYPEFETALYGAAGVAQHEGLTRLLLAHGADPNDEEAVYHSPETYELGSMKALVETGRITAENLAMMLIRKHDWHDIEGARYLLDHGADPNHTWRSGNAPIHHAVLRDNSLDMLALLLDRGGDPTSAGAHGSGVALAARMGRADLLALFEERGFDTTLDGFDAVVAACARGQETAASEDVKVLLRVHGGRLLTAFAGNDNAAGLARLIDLGVAVDTPVEGNGYWDVAPGSTALHVASWRSAQNALALLIERGADVNAPDGKGRTPLMLAVKATVDSYWTRRRTPDGVRALLEAGAKAGEVTVPTGYEAVDNLLVQFS